jgi:hypothetical protein
MRGLLPLYLFLLVSCQNTNSNSFDIQQYGSTTISGSTNFQAAYPILQNRCASCHTHSSWASYKTEEAWIASGYVVAGSADNSQVINRLFNYSSSGDMPKDGGPLPQSEYDVLVNWTDNITP